MNPYKLPLNILLENKNSDANKLAIILNLELPHFSELLKPELEFRINTDYLRRVLYNIVGKIIVKNYDSSLRNYDALLTILNQEIDVTVLTRLKTALLNVKSILQGPSLLDTYIGPDYKLVVKDNENFEYFDGPSIQAFFEIDDVYRVTTDEYEISTDDETFDDVDKERLLAEINHYIEKTETLINAIENNELNPAQFNEVIDYIYSSLFRRVTEINAITELDASLINNEPLAYFLTQNELGDSASCFSTLFEYPNDIIINQSDALKSKLSNIVREKTVIVKSDKEINEIVTEFHREMNIEIVNFVERVTALNASNFKRIRDTQVGIISLFAKYLPYRYNNLTVFDLNCAISNKTYFSHLTNIVETFITCRHSFPYKEMKMIYDQNRKTEVSHGTD